MKRTIFMFTLLWVIIFGFIAWEFYVLNSEENFIDKKNVIETYINNKEVFDELKNYELENPENIIIDESNIDNFNISDKKIRDDCICLLNKLKYKRVAEDDNTIQFVKQAGFECGQGVFYLKNEDKVSKLPFMKVLEQIEGNWYYFEVME